MPLTLAGEPVSKLYWWRIFPKLSHSARRLVVVNWRLKGETIFGRRSFNIRRGQAPTLPLSLTFCPTPERFSEGFEMSLAVDDEFFF